MIEERGEIDDFFINSMTEMTQRVFNTLKKFFKESRETKIVARIFCLKERRQNVDEFRGTCITLLSLLFSQEAKIFNFKSSEHSLSQTSDTIVMMSFADFVFKRCFLFQQTPNPCLTLLFQHTHS